MPLVRALRDDPTGDAAYTLALASTKQTLIDQGDGNSMAAALFALVQPFEMKYFATKAILIVDRTVLAVWIKVTGEGDAQLFGALAIMLASLLFVGGAAPYLDSAEDGAERVSRLSNFMTTAFAIAIAKDLISDDTAESVLLTNTLVLFLTGFLSLGPVRLIDQAIAGAKQKMAATKWAAIDVEAITQITSEFLESIKNYELAVISPTQVKLIVALKLDLVESFPALEIDGTPWAESEFVSFDATDDAAPSYDTLRSFNFAGVDLSAEAVTVLLNGFERTQQLRTLLGVQ